MFKQKSRFSSLIEEPSKKIPPIETKKINSLENKEFNFFKKEPIRDNYEKEENKKKKEILKKNELHIDNFPVLTNTKNSEVIDNKMNFIEKIEKQNTSIEETKIEKNTLKHGWSEINKKTNQITIFCNIQKKINIKDETKLAYDVFNNLVSLYEKRKYEYIEKWGYNEWEHNYQFPNYDYYYFDKLDEIYEENNEAYLDNEEDY
jgi:hypothetical protein